MMTPEMEATAHRVTGKAFNSGLESLDADSSSHPAAGNANSKRCGSGADCRTESAYFRRFSFSLGFLPSNGFFENFAFTMIGVPLNPNSLRILFTNWRSAEKCS